MGFLLQAAIWIHKIQYKTVCMHKGKVHMIGQVMKILKESIIFLAVITGNFKIGRLLLLQAHTTWRV